jgi:hypothetical protein
MNEAFARYFALFAERQLHLWALVTLPSFRRRGAGIMLLEWGMNMGRAKTFPVTVIARSMAGEFFRRRGFECVGSMSFKGSLGHADASASPTGEIDGPYSVGSQSATPEGDETENAASEPSISESTQSRSASAMSTTSATSGFPMSTSIGSLLGLKDSMDLGSSGSGSPVSLRPEVGGSPSAKAESVPSPSIPMDDEDELFKLHCLEF